MTVNAVIAGAGLSVRMGKSISKQLIMLQGKEVIVHTLLAFEQASSIKNIAVVCRAEDKNIIQGLINKYNITKAINVTDGGKTRQQSVLKGVECVKHNSDFIAVHDGARPLISPLDIDKTVENAIKYGASALGVYVKDTIKIVDNEGFICNTPNRSNTIAIQTPQVFKTEDYLDAVKLAESNNQDYTDDCQLIEAYGKRVYVTIGSYTNIKVTTPEDINIAESILEDVNKEN